jgi:hypothetical protein
MLGVISNCKSPTPYSTPCSFMILVTIIAIACNNILLNVFVVSNSHFEAVMLFCLLYPFGCIRRCVGSAISYSVVNIYCCSVAGGIFSGEIISWSLLQTSVTETVGVNGNSYVANSDNVESV